jgi:hypothetical protein
MSQTGFFTGPLIPPATVTSASIRPGPASAPSITAAAPSRLATSATTASALPPAEPTLSTSGAREASRRSLSTRSYPAFTSRVAIAAPCHRLHR